MNIQQNGASTPITANPTQTCIIPETRHDTPPKRIARQFQRPKRIQTRDRERKETYEIDLI